MKGMMTPRSKKRNMLLMELSFCFKVVVWTKIWKTFCANEELFNERRMLLGIKFQCSAASS